MTPPRAKFIGYQEGVPGTEPIALFDVIAPGHPRDRSTVSLKTLAELGIGSPAYPAFTDWAAAKQNKNWTRP